MGIKGDASGTEMLAASLKSMEKSTEEATRCCMALVSRARQLDSLTSPASDASSMLSRANANLAATLIQMRDARDKFDTLKDSEPSIEKLSKGVAELEKIRESGRSKGTLTNRVQLTEQDVYAAGDSMEILRDAYDYFAERRGWRSSPSTLGALEGLYKTGLDAMSLLIHTHLKSAGQAIRLKRKREAGQVLPQDETAQQTRARLAEALQNKDLMKSIGEYEDIQPVEARPIREIRSIFDCLGSHGYTLGPQSKKEPPGLANVFGIPAQKVVRTEKVGSGSYTNLTKEPLKTGFAQLDAYGEARKHVAVNSMDSYYRKIKQERKKRFEKATEEGIEIDEAGEAARDAIRCLEHAMVIVAGEKSIYRNIVAPSLQNVIEAEEEEEEVSPYFKKACAATYAYAVGSVVDRTLDILETVFLKECAIGQISGSKGSASALTVSVAATAAAAGLRILDGVRMLGPSLAKLCEMNVDDGVTDPNTSLSTILCIAIHRTAVKNCARTLENLAKAIQEDPLKGPLHRPKDASVSIVTKDVVDAIRLISPFASAYKSVSKRRALPWDPNMGEEAGEMDSYVRFLIMRLLNSLKGKAMNYIKDGRDDSQAKSNLFMMNNAFYLLEELGPDRLEGSEHDDEEHYVIKGSWFNDKVKKVLESEKSKYLSHWEILTKHLTAVSEADLDYQKNAEVLSLESGRLIKQRFSGFNEDFDKTFELHKKLCIIDSRLRSEVQQDVSEVFLHRYRRFYEKYTRIRFSKKHQSLYTKYHPDVVEQMLSSLYVEPSQ